MLKCRGIGVRVGRGEGERWLLRDVSLEVRAGEFVALVGPNGAGKSTLLRCLSGGLAPTEGEALVGGDRVARLDAGELARRRAVLSQRRPDPPGPTTGAEVAALGRYPHRRTSRRHEDEHAIASALERSEADPFADRMVQTLSGGEAARVDLARILAQQAPAIILDEPTNHLDPHHQLRTIGLCRELAREGRAVVAALHDLNLAAMLADRLAVLRDGRLVAFGPPQEVLTSELLEEVYGVPFEVWTRPCGRRGVLPLAASALMSIGDAACCAPTRAFAQPSQAHSCGDDCATSCVAGFPAGAGSDAAARSQPQLHSLTSTTTKEQ